MALFSLHQPHTTLCHTPPGLISAALSLIQNVSVLYNRSWTGNTSTGRQAAPRSSCARPQEAECPISSNRLLPWQGSNSYSTSSYSSGGCSHLSQSWRLHQLETEALPNSTRSSSGTRPGSSNVIHHHHQQQQQVQQSRHFSSSSNSSSAVQGAGAVQPLGQGSPAEPSTNTLQLLSGACLAGHRFQLLRHLGAGPYGLAEGFRIPPSPVLWCAQDWSSPGREVVLQLSESGDQASYMAAVREAAVLATAGHHPNILTPSDVFEHRTAHGRHVCMVFEKHGSRMDYVHQLWHDIYESHLISSSAGLTALRSIARQTLQALNHLHTNGIVHMDLSTRSVVIDKPFVPVVGHPWHFNREHDASEHTYQAHDLHTATVKLTGFEQAIHKALSVAPKPAPRLRFVWPGLSLYEEMSKNHPKGVMVPCSPFLDKNGNAVDRDLSLRAPEELLGMPYAAPAYDIWRFGCVLYELATGHALFDSGWMQLTVRADKKHLVQARSHEEVHLMHMQGVLGDFARNFIRRSPLFDKFFMPNDRLKMSRAIDMVPGASSIVWRLPRLRIDVDDTELVEFQHFLYSVLICDPERRPTAAQLLQHKWLQSTTIVN